MKTDEEWKQFAKKELFDKEPDSVGLEVLTFNKDFLQAMPDISPIFAFYIECDFSGFRRPMPTVIEISGNSFSWHAMIQNDVGMPLTRIRLTNGDIELVVARPLEMGTVVTMSVSLSDSRKPELN